MKLMLPIRHASQERSKDGGNLARELVLDGAKCHHQDFLKVKAGVKYCKPGSVLASLWRNVDRKGFLGYHRMAFHADNRGVHVLGSPEVYPIVVEFPRYRLALTCL